MGMFKKPSFRLIILMAAIGLFLAACGGGTPTPTPTPDPCSAAYLIAAINNANATPATEDTIDLSPGCLYELTSVDNFTDGSNGLPSIVSTIVINGNGATIQRSFTSGTPAFRIFHVSNIGMVTLNDLTVSNGLAVAATTGETAPNAGGGIYTNNRISLYGVVIDGNHAKLGGGVYNTIANGMTISGSTFQNNGADVENVPGERGGGIYSLSSATITRSTFFNNTATETGGAIENGPNGRLAISNSTFSGNSTVLLGGSAILNSGQITVMSYTTITNNTGGTPGAALLSGPDTIEIRNSIIANNTGGDCSYPATSTVFWGNLDSDGTCDGFTITDNPGLHPLANNGGPTLTHALLPNSPARDSAEGNCQPLDQRGEPRPHGSACDLGAYEFTGGGPPPAPTVIPSSVLGFVFIDDNGNGIRDTSEESTGIAGAHLTLMEGLCPGTSLISETWSNSPDGLYGFGMLMPGSYCIIPDPLQQTILPQTQEFTVGNDEHLEDVNFYLPDPSFSTRCNLFDDLEFSLVMMTIPRGTTNLTLYFKLAGGVPGLELEIPDDPDPWIYRALLGETESVECSFQGYESRLYCTFVMPATALGSARDLTLYLNECDDPILFQPRVSIPLPQCYKDLGEEDCLSAGGTWKRPLTGGDYYCECP